MHDSKVRSRLKAQLTKFSAQLCAGLSKPLAKFVSQMLFGIQSSQDVKLSNIGRSLKEDSNSSGGATDFSGQIPPDRLLYGG